MQFTVIFNSHEAYDLSYSLLFIPCPVWQTGDREIINLHPRDPRYRRGDLAVLLKMERIEEKLAPGRRQAAIVVHTSSVGVPDDLLELQRELMAEGFAVHMLSFLPS